MGGMGGGHTSTDVFGDGGFGDHPGHGLGPMGPSSMDFKQQGPSPYGVGPNISFGGDGSGMGVDMWGQVGGMAADAGCVF
jgi:hypothetical protein